MWRKLQIAKCKLQIDHFVSALFNIHFAICVLQFAMLPSALAAEPAAIKSPVSPKDSLKHLVVEDGLRVELVASEPNVVDPVAIRFDEDGRMWVVEMRDYPNTAVTGEKTHSRISVLDDRDGDGFYETATVFADGLRFATGIQPWKGGVVATVAGEVIYLKDTNGDGRADVREKWYTGFSQGNQQLRANHPTLALDNHIYVANGLRGGNIVDARTPNAEPLSISGMDFRFDPLTRKFEAVSGVGQFGLTFDDYNNRFVCTNRNPAIHVVLEDRYLKKNPLVTVSAVATDVAKAGADSKLFPIGRSWTTSHLHANQFTAACGLDIYRGDALSPSYYGNLFVCDPTAHLVHREAIRPKGVTFESKPVVKDAEFLASRDEWFSPVNIETGPDGALYVVDMYRAVIEHPEWMPAELKKRPDLLLGNDRGRIYRVVPKDWRRPKPAKLSRLASRELVKTLSDDNAWWRETASRLLLERGDKSVTPQLRQLALEGESSQGRIQALRLLEGLGRLDEKLLLERLDDGDPRVVEQAIVAAEPQLAKSPALRERISKLVAHEDARVRFQSLLTALPLPAAPTHAADQWELNAMQIATGKRGGDVLQTLLSHEDLLQANVKKPAPFVAALARLAAASKDAAQQKAAIHALCGSPPFRFAGLASFMTEMSRDSLGIVDLAATLDDETVAALDGAFGDARSVATNAKAPRAERVAAVNLLAFDVSAADLLVQLALEKKVPPVRLRAIFALARQGQLEAWQRLLEGFSSETPTVQKGILDAALTSVECARAVLGEIVAGRIKPTEVDLARANLLLQKLFAESLPKDREKALEEYRAVLKIKADPERGRAVFEKNCATCHRIDKIGVDVAPDISDSRERPPEQLLTDIIQPNRAIDSNYFSYTAVTIDGLTHTGVLTAETSTSVTLKQPEGKSITLPRGEIDELRSDGVSFMPDGLEKNIPPQDMADLISFIKNWRYLIEAPELKK
jgi:putative membrane-bound dehydrogenase-like protein